MLRSLTAVIFSLVPALAVAACPEYLNQEVRKLHSKQTVNLCELQAGGPLLVINTASHCGYTKQFEGLEALNQAFKDRGLTVVGFASDDFRQEARDEEAAAGVCFVNFGVTFTMIAPSHVKGDEANPLFRALASQAGEPSWNFNKYLLDADGKVVERFGSNTAPDSEALVAAIESVLPKQ